MRRAGLLPSLVQLVAVKEPEDAAHEKQDGLVKRSRDRQKTSRTSPSQRSWDLAVSNHKLDGSDRASHGGARALHAFQCRQPRSQDGGRGLGKRSRNRQGFLAH
jgi:hypothetical protein